MKTKLFFLAAVLLVTLPLLAVLHVPVQFPAIQTAINAAANGDTIVVDQGSYFENIDFQGKQITLSSNFIYDHNRNTITSTVICGTGAGSGPVVKFNQGETRATSLIGFEVISGRADYGAGIKIEHSSPSIEYCVISNNVSTLLGGGVYIYDGSPRLSNCLIADNSAEDGPALCFISSGAEVINCTIVNNQAKPLHLSDPVYGIHISSGSQPLLLNSIIWQNTRFVDGEHLVANIGFSDFFNPNSLIAAFCDLQGGETGIYDYNGSVTWLNGNIDQNPVLDEDYNIQTGSPAIDAGTTTFTLGEEVILNLSSNDYFGSQPDMGWWESNYSGSGNSDNTIPTPVAISCYPNPFSASTTIKSTGVAPTKVEIFNIKGQKVQTLTNDSKSQSIAWDGRNNHGQQVPAGLYFIRANAGNQTMTTKAIKIQ